jgi:uncharacterized integral membrane protein
MLLLNFFYKWKFKSFFDLNVVGYLLIEVLNKLTVDVKSFCCVYSRDAMIITAKVKWLTKFYLHFILLLIFIFHCKFTKNLDDILCIYIFWTLPAHEPLGWSLLPGFGLGGVAHSIQKKCVDSKNFTFSLRPEPANKHKSRSHLFCAWDAQMHIFWYHFFLLSCCFAFCLP